MKSAGFDAFEPLTPTLALATIVGLEQQGVTLKAAFLPEEGGGFGELEATLTAQRLQGWFDALEPARVDLTLPRPAVPMAPLPAGVDFKIKGLSRQMMGDLRSRAVTASGA